MSRAVPRGPVGRTVDRMRAWVRQRAMVPHSRGFVLRAVARVLRGCRAMLRRFRPAKPSLPGHRLTEDGEVRLRLAGFRGVFAFDARSDVYARVLLTGDFEPEARQALLAMLRPGDAIDVGANVGLYSVLLADLLAPPHRILAIEPVPRMTELLERNLAQNEVQGRVVVAQAAASATAGELRLELIEGKEEYSSATLAHRSVDQLASETITVRCETIDTLVALHALAPRFMKIDVEGHEVEALRGARATIEQHRPDLLLEYCPDLLTACGTSGEELLGLLNAYGYGIEWISRTELVARPQ